MSHQLEFVPWMRQIRRQAAAILVTAIMLLTVAEIAYSSLSGSPVFEIVAQELANVLPWVEVACGLTIIGTGFALASTWSSRDWWVGRWARSHENFAG